MNRISFEFLSKLSISIRAWLIPLGLLLYFVKFWKYFCHGSILLRNLSFATFNIFKVVSFRDLIAINFGGGTMLSSGRTLSDLYILREANEFDDTVFHFFGIQNWIRDVLSVFMCIGCLAVDAVVTQIHILQVLVRLSNPILLNFLVSCFTFRTMLSH